MCILAGSEIMHPFYVHIGSLTIETPFQGEICLIVKPIINWAHSNSLNAYNSHSDWQKLKVYATKMSVYF